MTNSTKKIQLMIINALLLALAIIIPLIFPKIYIPPFSATLASHLPVMVAMFINPISAVFVSIGSAVGFFFAFPGNMIIAARALTHLVFAFVGSYLIKKKVNIFLIIILTAILHALFEMMIVMIPPFNFDFIESALWVGVGTLAHHFVDAIITYPVILTLRKANIINFSINTKKIILK